MGMAERLPSSEGKSSWKVYENGSVRWKNVAKWALGFGVLAAIA